MLPHFGARTRSRKTGYGVCLGSGRKTRFGSPRMVFRFRRSEGWVRVPSRIRHPKCRNRGPGDQESPAGVRIFGGRFRQGHSPGGRGEDQYQAQSETMPGRCPESNPCADQRSSNTQIHLGGPGEIERPVNRSAGRNGNLPKPGDPGFRRGLSDYPFARSVRKRLTQGILKTLYGDRGAYGPIPKTSSSNRSLHAFSSHFQHRAESQRNSTTPLDPYSSLLPASIFRSFGFPLTSSEPFLLQVPFNH